jgi:hypothetical protein
MHYKRARNRGEFVPAKPPKYDPICSVAGCGCAQSKRGYCDKHYRRIQKRGTLETVRQPPGGLVKLNTGYLTLRVDGKPKLHHVIIAERALGRPLPKGAEVHHVNEDPSDNSPSNLVVCPDAAYHRLLHARMRARDACGNPDWKKCGVCKQYDDPSNMTGLASRGQPNKLFYHKACAAKKSREQKAARKQTPAVAAAMQGA